MGSRFHSPDVPFIDQRLGNPQSWNLYPYARNNPVVFNDPTGNAADGPMGGTGLLPGVHHEGGISPFMLSGGFNSSWYTEISVVGGEIILGMTTTTSADVQQATGQQPQQRQPESVAGPFEGPYVADLKSPEIAPLLDPNHVPSTSDIVGDGECVTLTKRFSGMGPYVNTHRWRAGARVVDDENIKPGTAIATFNEKGRYPSERHDRNSGIFLSRGLNGSIWILDQWPERDTGQRVHPPQPRMLRPNQSNPSNSSDAYYLILVAPIVAPRR